MTTPVGTSTMLRKLIRPPTRQDNRNYWSYKLPPAQFARTVPNWLDAYPALRRGLTGQQNSWPKVVCRRKVEERRFSAASPI